MNTNELKAAIERVRALDTLNELKTVLALAEIGRLAVEHIDRVDGLQQNLTVAGVDAMCERAATLNAACRAFLAAREGKS